jgi:hypothetical protein
MRWPEKIDEGVQIDQMGSTIDILPTISEITQSKLPVNKIDGVSLVAVLEGQEEANPRNEFCYFYMGDLIAVRKGDWKLVFPHHFRSYEGMTPGNDGFPGKYAKGVVHEKELYHLKTDISESNNVIKNHTEIVAELEKIADSIRWQLGDNILNITGHENRKPGRHEVEKTKVKHLGMGAKVDIQGIYSSKYSGIGNSTLSNGILGSMDYGDGEWLGFQGTDIELNIDLLEVQNLKEISCGFMENQKSWIFLPEQFKIFYSIDGKTFKNLKEIQIHSLEEKIGRSIERLTAEFPQTSIRFIKIQASNPGPCPEWHTGVGGKTWLFLDEVIVK